ncbi:MAG: pectate lyase [Pedobacter sp.]|jgi:PelA/Pel-15E family pectate lyase
MRRIAIQSLIVYYIHLPRRDNSIIGTVKIILSVLFYFSFSISTLLAQKKSLSFEARQAMLNATKFMVEKVSTNGGYVSHYLPDFSRRWAEMEAFDTQIMLTYGITPKMGDVFLDSYNATGDEYYYQSAEKVAQALIWGQHQSGGWDYIIDFAGVPSLKKWYNTIGKNAWGWDEYNHYYGTSTFKNETTTSAARFLLRIYLEKLDSKFKPALDKTIQHFIKSQYPLGGWPQRYPVSMELKDYSSNYTFNDDLTWENMEFLIQCYITLGDERLLDPIQRGMNFSLITQQGNPQGGWAEIYDMDIKPAHGRKYEPSALMPGQTIRQIGLLMRFYEYTGDRKFLARIPDAFQWLESTRLTKDMNCDGKYTHPVFVELGTNRPLFAHRKGTGVNSGAYYIDYKDDNPLLHYGSKGNFERSIKILKEEYKRINELSPEEVVKNSPLKGAGSRGNKLPQEFFDYDHGTTVKTPNESEVRGIINSLDAQHRWLIKHEWISRPYSISATGVETNTAPLSTEGGAQIRDTSEQQYISTQEYMKNVNLLIKYITNPN